MVNERSHRCNMHPETDTSKSRGCSLINARMGTQGNRAITHRYIYQHDKHLGIVKRLLVRGANVHAMNGLGETPY
jgi:hypothetical protein